MCTYRFMVWYLLRVKFLFWNPLVPSVSQTPLFTPLASRNTCPVSPLLISWCLRDRYSPANVSENDEMACVLVSLFISNEVAGRTRFALKFEKHTWRTHGNYSGNNICNINVLSYLQTQKADLHFSDFVSTCFFVFVYFMFNYFYSILSVLNCIQTVKNN